MSNYFLLFLYVTVVFGFHIQPTFAKTGGIKCREKEKQALLMFKGGLQDNGTLSTWRDLENEDCCKWKGVQCSNRTGHVTVLQLQGTRELYLKGLINPSLADLQHLAQLDLSSNDFSGSQIPEFIGSLKSLKYLNLSLVGFNGTIPHQLGMLPYLQYLDLRGNKLGGAIPSELGMLSHLKYLDLSYNFQLNGTIPYQLGMIPHLHYLDLRWNQLGGAIPLELGMLSHLKYLDLSYNFGLNGTIPYQLGMIPHLQHLKLNGNELDGVIPCQLGRLSYLQYLDLSSNNLNGTIPYQLGNFSRLLHLDLSYNFLEGTIPFHLGNLSMLKSLSLGYNDLKFFKENHTGVVDWLSALSSLTDLDLSGLPNFNHSIHWIQLINMLPSLINLSLRSSGLSDTNLIFPPHSHWNISSSLSTLDMSRNMFISSKIFQWIFNYTSNLRKLYLIENILLKGPIPNDFDRMSSLEYLVLSSNNLEGEIPKSIGNIGTLQILNIQNNNLTGVLPQSIGSLAQLVELDLSFNNLGGEIPKSIGNIGTLQILNIQNNNLTGVLPQSIGSLAQLVKLDLSSNNLEGEIPKSIGNIGTLQILNIQNNSLTGVLPQSIGSLAQLVELDLSYNNLEGEIPKSICNIDTLRILNIQNNRLIGVLPPSIGSLAQLVELDLGQNSLKGLITEFHFTNLSKLKGLDLSYNLLDLKFSDEWIPPFQLTSLYLASCNLGPGFPKWLQNQNDLWVLDISDAMITDFVPEWFWGMSQSINYMNISYNKLRGKIANLPLVFNNGPDFILTSNQFEGSVPPFMLKAIELRLSKNKFSDLNLLLCGKNTTEPKLLGLLDVSSNELVGHMPNCWNHLKYLGFLDLSNNKLSGEIPTSLGALINLEALILRNNSLVGEFPSLVNCTNLLMLDVGQNNLSGTIPSWIGTSLQQLAILSVRVNHFHGRLPLNLCHLREIQILDLSLNSLSGGIPPCLKNLIAMAQKSINTSVYYSVQDYVINNTFGISSDLQLFMMWKGAEFVFKNPELLLKSIDLSSNHLTGEIPMEIGDLFGLISLNLSRNNLSGQVTSKIGNLESLEFLDLSRNNLSGEIPSSLAQIHRLTDLDVSNNRLCGKIPIGTQLQSFSPSNYEGNLCLCGKPLDRKCPGEETPPPQIPPALEEENNKSIFMQAFYMSMGLGFPVGFWGLLGPILLKQSWRHAYLRFLDNLIDTIYVMVVVNMRSRLLHR